jgi:hypothetical protein
MAEAFYQIASKASQMMPADHTIAVLLAPAYTVG